MSISQDSFDSVVGLPRIQYFVSFILVFRLALRCGLHILGKSQVCFLMFKGLPHGVSFYS